MSLANNTPINLLDPELDIAIALCEPIGDKTYNQCNRLILDGIDGMTYDRAAELADWVTALNLMTNNVNP